MKILFPSFPFDVRKKPNRNFIYCSFLIRIRRNRSTYVAGALTNEAVISFGLYLFLSFIKKFDLDIRIQKYRSLHFARESICNPHLSVIYVFRWFFGLMVNVCRTVIFTNEAPFYQKQVKYEFASFSVINIYTRVIWVNKNFRKGFTSRNSTKN